jgi:hypothetical protein
MDWRLMRRMAISAAIVVALTGGDVIVARAQNGGVLRFGTYGGTMLEGQKIYLGEPFEALTGAKKSSSLRENPRPTTSSCWTIPGTAWCESVGLPQSSIPPRCRI